VVVAAEAVPLTAPPPFARLARRVRGGASRVVRSRWAPRLVRDPIVGWRWSRAASRALRVPRRPETFNEKTLHKMAYDRRPLLATLSDKVAVREYVARAVGEQYLPELHLVTDDVDRVRREVLPRDVAVKASHGSGGCVLIAGFAPLERRLPTPPAGWPRLLVHPDAVDWDTLRALCGEWLGARYGYWEWPYRDLPARILAEELLREGEAIARDFKVFVFHGRARVVSVDHDRFVRHVRSLYTPEWERVPFELKFPAGPDVERPAALGEMIAIAERLARETDFLRVDLYAPGARIVVGELTSFHGAGLEEFRPASYDRWLGSSWTPPKRYR